MEDVLYRIKCPDCRLELHWDDEAFAQWKQGPTKCPQCGAALGDMMADEVRPVDMGGQHRYMPVAK